MTMQSLLRVIAVTAGALALSIPASAAEKAASKVQKTPARETSKAPNAWSPVTVTGKILDVYPAQHLVIVEGQDNVPFDVRVTPSTRIEAGAHRLTLNNLSSDTNKNASVRILPERSGDIARSIRLNG